VRWELVSRLEEKLALHLYFCEEVLPATLLQPFF
jgi:hypothetical protein